MKTLIIESDPESFQKPVDAAVELLSQGKLVALPTETVYGLAADALNPEAVAQVFSVKQRPSFDPLIIHIGHPEQVKEYCDLDDSLEAVVDEIIDLFWPGPLTLVLPKKDVIPDLVTSGQSTVAIRMSSHPLMLEVCRKLNRPIAAPSANQFGRISPTSTSAVLKEMDSLIPLIIDGGACYSGLESTIIRVVTTSARPELHLLRPGPITKEELQTVGKVIRPKKSPSPAQDSPGQLESHYAPKTPLFFLKNPSEFKPQADLKYGLLSYRGDPKDGFIDLHDWEHVEELSPGKGKLQEAAVRLFFAMRQLDESDVDFIIAETVSETGIGVAINDRLKKASQNK